MFQLFNETKDVLEAIKYDDNIVVFSSLREFYHPIKSKGFAIKYVFEGSERYIINGQKYDVKAGKYLLTNYLLEGSVEIESNKNVKGICINIIPSMLTEVVASMKRPDTAFSDSVLGEFFSTTDFWRIITMLIKPNWALFCQEWGFLLKEIICQLIFSTKSFSINYLRKSLLTNCQFLNNYSKFRPSNLPQKKIYTNEFRWGENLLIMPFSSP